MPRKLVTNWGNFPSVDANVSESSNVSAIREFVRVNDSVIARGNGRCYGDSSLNENIFSTLRLNRFLEFDKVNGTLECEAGVLLSEVLEVIVRDGFFLPVTPGTKFITVGGAIAADVHGKNHHREGAFTEHVLHLDILTSSGEVVRCSRDESGDIYRQTCGGMGLTGIILSAKFRLRVIETSYVRQVSQKAPNLERVMELFEEAEKRTYSVAWLDCLAPVKRVGRSVIISGDHCLQHELPSALKNDPLRPAPRSGFGLPFYLPAFLLNFASVKTFNFFYYQIQARTAAASIVHFDNYFYPLDRVANWNRLYGRNGFLQYQFVLPKEKSYDGLIKILDRIARSGLGSPLAVLKLLGRQNPDAVMSFPMPGYTLALDFKVSPAVFRLLDELDELILDYDGRIYLAKDARMKADVFHRCYNEQVSSGSFSSLQSTRLKY